MARLASHLYIARLKFANGRDTYMVTTARAFRRYEREPKELLAEKQAKMNTPTREALRLPALIGYEVHRFVRES